MPLRVTIELIGKPEPLGVITIYNTHPDLPALSDYEWTLQGENPEAGFVGGHKRRDGWPELVMRVLTQIACHHRGRRADGVCTQCGKEVGER